MKIIYTRTSSIFTFKKDSIARQQDLIFDKYPYQKEDKNLLIKSENCKSEVLLEEREVFNSIIELSKDHKIELYVENPSRIGRDVDILNKVMEYKNININSVLLPEVFTQNGKEGEMQRSIVGKSQSEEKRYQVLNLALRRKDAIARGIKFDGRKTILENQPPQREEQQKIQEEDKNLSISEITKKVKLRNTNGLPFNRSTIYRSLIRQGWKPGKREFHTTSFQSKERQTEELIDNLIDKWKDHQVYIIEMKTFFIYEDFYWKPILIEEVQTLVYYTLKNKGFTRLKAESITNKIILFIKKELIQKKFPENKNILAFKNGVLNLKTNSFSPLSPSIFNTTLIPWEYNHDKNVTQEDIPNINKYLDFITKKDLLQKEFLISFIHCVLKSDTHYQVYLEIIGSGGTGKSTFQNQISSLVGRENVSITELKYQENSRFETSSLISKKLILITDSSQYRGTVSVLKSIVGEDFIRYEEKNKSLGVPFKASGLVVISSNEFLNLGDLTTGLNRRRIILIFNQTPQTEGKDQLIFFNSDLKKWEGSFVPELSNFINFLLKFDSNKINNLMSKPLLIPSLKKNFIINLIQTNPIAAFIDEYIVILPVHFESKFPLTLNSDKISLYETYKLYCSRFNVSPLSLKRFSHIFQDIISYFNINQIPILKQRSYSGVYFTNIGLINQNGATIEYFITVEFRKMKICKDVIK